MGGKEKQESRFWQYTLVPSHVTPQVRTLASLFDLRDHLIPHGWQGETRK